jgi:hypothetical protein
MSCTSGLIRKQCDELILAMVGEELAPLWWTQPNKHLEGETPEDVFKRSPNEVYVHLVKFCIWG